MKKVIFINFLFLIIGIFFLEVFFGKWLTKEKYFCNYLLCGKNYTFEHNLFGYEYKGIYSKNLDGLRGNFLKNSNIKILAIGGSTTDQRYLSNNDTWTNQLQMYFEIKNKNFKIANAGIDGQSTIGHIWNFQNWFKNIKDLRPKVIIFYIGINDLMVRESSHLDFKKIKFEFSKLYFKQLIKNNSAIYHFYRSLYSNIIEKKTILNFNTKAKEKNFSYNVKPSITRENLEMYEKKYLEKDLKKRLEILIEETLKLNAIPIFISQNTKRWRKKDLEIFGVSSFNDSLNMRINKQNLKINSGDIGLLEKKFSSFLMKFCKNKKLFCINGFKYFELKTEDTYDLMHLNNNGSKKIAKIIFNKLNQNKEIKEKLNIN